MDTNIKAKRAKDLYRQAKKYSEEQRVVGDKSQLDLIPYVHKYAMKELELRLKYFAHILTDNEMDCLQDWTFWEFYKDCLELAFRDLETSLDSEFEDVEEIFEDLKDEEIWLKTRCINPEWYYKAKVKFSKRDLKKKKEDLKMLSNYLEEFAGSKYIPESEKIFTLVYGDGTGED